MSNGLQPHVQRVSPAQAEAARGLVLMAAQARDTGDIAFHVDNAMDAPDGDAMLVMLGWTSSASIASMTRNPRARSRPSTGTR